MKYKCQHCKKKFRPIKEMIRLSNGKYYCRDCIKKRWIKLNYLMRKKNE